MKKLPLLLLPFALCASTVLRDGNVTIGPVDALNCTLDGGLVCRRDAGMVGFIDCAVAGSTTRGCVEPGTAQNFGTGTKTFGGTIQATGGVDAGYLHTPDYHLEGSTLQCTDSVTPMILQSNAPDSLTSSLTPAMRFYLSQALTSGDLGWCFTDSTGTDRLCGTAAGTWTFAAHATTAGTATVSGGNFTSTLGAGGASSGATPGGAGGAYSFTAGAGGDSAGAAAAGTGGALTLIAGAGGALNGTQPGGAGGAVFIRAGASKSGAAAPGTAAFAGGNGSNVSGALAPSAGGPVSVTGGTGGRTSVGTGASGGAVTVAGGVGGDGVSGTAGVGGALTLSGGNAGAVGVTGGVGGAVILDTGASSGAAAAATMSIGAASAGAITLGRTGQNVVAPGNVLVSQALATSGTFAVGASGTSMSDSRTCTLTVNPGLIGANVCATDTTGGCTGATTGDFVACDIPPALENGLIASCWISAGGTMKVRLCNHTAGGITPASATYGLRYFH